MGIRHVNHLPRVNHQRVSLLFLGLVPMVLAACNATAQTNGGDIQRGYEAFAGCMRDHGANVGQPVLHADGSVSLPPGEGALTPREELIEAAARCQPILSSRGLPSPGPVTLDEGALEDLQHRSAAFASCLRDSGIDWPVPSWDGGAITNWDPSVLGVDLTDPLVQEAGAACAEQTGFDPLLAHALEDGSR